jgi:hypothetical protein
LSRTSEVPMWSRALKRCLARWFRAPCPYYPACGCELEPWRGMRAAQQRKREETK